MELGTVVATVENGEQDTVLKVLQIYNREKSQCFTFDDEEREERKKMAQLLIKFLERELQPSCQVTCLESIRILSRDKYCLDPFTTKEGLKTLSRHAGIDYSEELIREVPDLDVILESLKCLCNIVFSSPRAQELTAEARLVVGLAKRIKLYNERSLPHEVKFFDLRLLFLLTALRVDIRQQLAQELRGIGLMTDTLELTLGVKWMDPYEVATEEGLLPPLPRQETERAMEILKVLFNITFDSSKREVDEEDAALYRHLGALLRHCLMISADGEDRTEEFHSHTVNLLGNLPLKCLDVLLTPKVRPGSLEYMGVNMDAVNILLDFLERRLDRGHKLKESLTPVLNLLTESARVHRQTRKFLKAKVLPPLRDVKNRPEVGNSLRNKLVRLMTHIDTDVKHCAAEFLFVLCKESVSRFVKYTGYGNAAGLLAARGLMAGGREEGEYSEDEDTDTEEYKEAKPNINPVTGRVEEKLPNPMEGMTEEQKEYEAMKLVNMFDKLSRNAFSSHLPSIANWRCREEPRICRECSDHPARVGGRRAARFVHADPSCAKESKSSSPWASRRVATWPPWRTPSVIWLTRGHHLTQTWGWTDPDLLPQPQRAGEPLSVLPSELVLHPEASTGPELSLWCLNPAWTLTVHREEHLLPPPQLYNHLSFQGIVTAWLYLGLSHWQL